MERDNIKCWVLPNSIWAGQALKTCYCVSVENWYKKNNLLGRHEFAKSELSHVVAGLELNGVALRNHWLYHKLSRDM